MAGVLLTGLCLAGCLPLLLGFYVLRDPAEASRRLYRWRLGGELVDTDGVVRQEFRNDCGPAALKMVLEHFGIEVSLEECRREAGLSSRGTSMLRLAEIARRRGVDARGVRFDPGRLRGVPTPLLAYLRMGHFVVLERIDPRTRSLFVKDPALGLLRFSPEEFAAVWRGEALVFRPGVDTATPPHLPGGSAAHEM